MSKWQQLSTIVYQQSELLQFKPSLSIKKIILIRTLNANFLVFCLQYIGLILSSSTLSPLWFASGSACGFIFLRGKNILPGIWLGSFCFYFLNHVSLLFAAICSSIQMLQPLFILLITQRFITPTLIFYRKTFLTQFVLCCLFITAITSFALMKLMYSTVYLPLFLQEWLANWNGVVIVAIALLTWDAFFPEINRIKKTYIIFSGAILFVLIYLSYLHLFLFIVPILIFTSLYFGWCGLVFSVFFLGFSLNLVGYLGLPLLSDLKIIFSFQFVLATATLIGLYIAIESEKKHYKSAPLK